MTNKERLEANNAKIEAIQKTLNNKILAIQTGGKGITIDLPEAFANLTSVNTFALNDDVILANGDNTGFWVYTISTSTWERINYANDLIKFSYFVKVDDTKCLLSTSSSSKKGIWLYNNSTREIKQISSAGYYFNISFKVNDKILLASLNSSTIGVYRYTPSNDTIEQLYAEGWNWMYIMQLTNNKWILSTNTTDTTKGALLYDESTNSITLLSTTGRRWTYMLKINDNKILIDGIGAGDGVKVFNNLTNELTTITITGSIFTEGYPIGDGRWLLGSTSGGTGIVIYNENTDEASNAYSDSKANWIKFQKVGETRFLVGNASNGYGFVRYDGEDDSFKKFTPVSNGQYFGIFALATTTKCFISSSYQNYSGLWVYDSETDEITKLSSSGYNYDLATIENGNYYIECSDKTIFKGKYQYHPDTNKVTLVKYYVEGV